MAQAQQLTDDECGFCGAVLSFEGRDGRTYTRLINVEYPYDHKDHYDGISEIRCPDCGVRVGRWSGRVLLPEQTEPRWGRPS